MKKFIWKKRFSLPETIGLLSIVVIGMAVISYAVTVPNTFVQDTVISADEVNANFSALVTAVTILESQVATLQADLDSVDNRLSTVEGNNALLLDPYLTISSGTINGLSGPHIILHDANLHIQSGSGATDAAINGLGNLVVGYNEGPSTLIPGDRGGSHNLIVGPEHRYLSYGGFVAGLRNTVNGIYSSVSGGVINKANGDYSSVSGGYNNKANGDYSSISGGYWSTAGGQYSSISGGFTNSASGQYSSISGGFNRSVSGLYDWRAGGLFQEQ